MIPASRRRQAIHEVIPELKGKMNGTAIRVPTPNVSLIDLTSSCPGRTVESITRPSGGAEAREGRPAIHTELTCGGYNGNPASAIFDSTQTAVAEGGRLAKVFAWYDNEWGFSNRMVDVALLIAAGCSRNRRS